MTPLQAASGTERLYYATALSNLIRGYDKYARTYDKSRIPESSFPDRFFLIPREELQIGLTKAAPLPEKTGLPGDRLIVLETQAGASELHPNLRTGLGRFVRRSFIRVHGIHLVDGSGDLRAVEIEEALARSLRLHAPRLPAFSDLTPRSVSVLPMAKACPARCPFCFSKASVSADIEQTPIDWDRVGTVVRAAREKGATRAVVTGGGEPTLMRRPDLERLVRTAAAEFRKVVLITNGYRWGKENAAEVLGALDDAGLSVLAMSRHHFDPRRNAALMNLETRTEEVAERWAAARSGFRRLAVRWICVLQKGGIEDRESLERYLDWAAATGVEEICFKELYVSSSVESEYFDRKANDWSAAHQVPLRLVLDLAASAGWTLRETLPWGAAVYEGLWRGRPIRVAAYTEPSVLWELTNRMCRSWNLMADGRCLASLEDRRSEVLRRDV